jgi:ribose transport system ATP-binding protein
LSEFILQLKDFEPVNNETTNNRVNIAVKYGEVHAIIVEKDIEKEDIIQSVSGNMQNNQGRIIYKDRLLKRDSLTRVKDIAILSKTPLLIEHFTVAENLTMDNYPVRGLSIDWIQVLKNARQLLEDLKLDIDYSAQVMSLNPKKRKLVAIARAFLQKPDLIIMHEPTEGLESESVRNFYNIIQKFKDNNGSVLYITSQWEEVLKIADRISVLNDGTLKGPFLAEEVKKDPKILLNSLGNYRFEKSSQNESDEVLDAVFKAAKYLTSEYELKDVLLLLAKQATKTMHADGCIINLIDESTNTIIDTLEYKNQEELRAELKKDTILQLINDTDIYYANKRNKEFFSLFENINKVRTIICIPVLIRSQVAGLIQIFYQDYYVYSEDEFKYLSTFARQAALAIEDTRLMGRSALLQESHHRIKNNLQSIISLIDIQKELLDKLPDMSLDNVLDSIIARIKSIAAVHDLLSKDKSGRSIINIKNLINVIVEFVSFDPKIKVELKLDDIFIPYNKAASIALIINELVINCLKHAFPDGYDGQISISCKRDGEQVKLCVQDNGIGVPEEFSFDKVQNLGLSIVESIVINELKGNIEFLKKQGLTVRIVLPVEKLVIGLNQEL